MTKLKGVGIGAGYFSQFHYDAWERIPEVDLVAVCDLDPARARSVAARHGVSRHYADYREMLDVEKPDFVDVITRPETHREICREAADRGIHIICQKPLAPSFESARAMVSHAAGAKVRFMVHENFRFQPWHREIKRQLDAGAIGERLHSVSAASRPGDGWGERAYLARQPYFRDMPRFLIHETGIHFIDTFRFLAGEVRRVNCILRRLNPAISGEDCGLLIFEFESGAVGLWDANRYNESTCEDPRYTFGEFLIEGDAGSLRLAADGALSLKRLGEPEQLLEYRHEKRGFAGDCCHATQRHFVAALLDGAPFETSGAEYLKNLAIQEAFYQASEKRLPVVVL